MNTRVLVVVADKEDTKDVLMHWYIQEQNWDVPGGLMEGNETPVQAARRELLERTGYDCPDESKLMPIFDCEEMRTRFGVPIDPDGNLRALFQVSMEYLVKVAEPGERGGYKTKICWHKQIPPGEKNEVDPGVRLAYEIRQLVRGYDRTKQAWGTLLKRLNLVPD